MLEIFDFISLVLGSRSGSAPPYFIVGFVIRSPLVATECVARHKRPCGTRGVEVRASVAAHEAPALVPPARLCGVCEKLNVVWW